MITELKQFQVADENDLLQLHGFATQLAQLFGLDVPGQLRFASTITRTCDLKLETNIVLFSIENCRDNKRFITATIVNSVRNKKKRIELQTEGHDLFPILPLTLIMKEKLPHRI